MDLVFVVDETNSMGIVIRKLQNVIANVIQTAQKVASGGADLPAKAGALRLGLIGFKDHPILQLSTAGLSLTSTASPNRWAALTKVPLSEDVDLFKARVDALVAEGGDDCCEAVTDGLAELTKLEWRYGNVNGVPVSRMAILITDAAPHGTCGGIAPKPHVDLFPFGCPCGDDWLEQAKSLAEMKVCVNGIWCANSYTERGEQGLLCMSHITQTTGGTTLEYRGANSEPHTVLLSIVNTIVNSALPVPGTTPVADAALTITPAPPPHPLARLFAKLTQSLPTSPMAVSRFRPEVPLRSVDVDAKIGFPLAEIVVKHRYCNDTDSPLEVTFEFPGDTTGKLTVTGFEAVIDGRTIVGKCMSKEAAFEVYDNGIASGQGAYLLEASEDQANRYRLNIGNLPQGKEAVITLTMVEKLAISAAELQFELPSDFLATDIPCSFRAEIEGMPTKVQTVNVVPSYPITVGSAPSTEGGNKTTLLLNNWPKVTELTVIISIDPLPASLTCVEEWSEDPSSPLALCAVFAPMLEDVVSQSIQKDVYILLDTSASMNVNGNFNVAQGAAKALIGKMCPSLPGGVRFNVVSFGSTCSFLFGEPRTVQDRAAAAEAVKFIDAAVPRGGSQIYKALRAIDNSALRTAAIGAQSSLTKATEPAAPAASARRPAAVIVITDGELSAPQRIPPDFRAIPIFTLVVNHEPANPTTLELKSQILQNSRVDNDIAATINSFLARILEASSETTVQWSPADVVKFCGPSVISQPLGGTHALATCFVPRDQLAQVCVSAGRIEGQGRANFTSTQIRSGKALNRFCAGQAIRVLEEFGQSRRTDIIQLSKKYSVSSKFASFVALDARGEVVQDALEKRTVRASAFDKDDSASGSEGEPQPDREPTEPKRKPLWEERAEPQLVNKEMEICMPSYSGMECPAPPPPPPPPLPSTSKAIPSSLSQMAPAPPRSSAAMAPPLPPPLPRPSADKKKRGPPSIEQMVLQRREVAADESCCMLEAPSSWDDDPVPKRAVQMPVLQAAVSSRPLRVPGDYYDQPATPVQVTGLPPLPAPAPVPRVYRGPTAPDIPTVTPWEDFLRTQCEITCALLTEHPDLVKIIRKCVEDYCKEEGFEATLDDMGGYMLSGLATLKKLASAIKSAVKAYFKALEK